jgi:regulator of sigma E protease
MYNATITILAIIWVIGILVFIHELGHFLVAKLSGVKVLTFSLGFGPKLIGKRIGETEYRISALPLGGYVRPLGDNPREKVPKGEEKRAFLQQSVTKRMAIAAAGPLANFFLAVLIYSLVFSIGIPIPVNTPVVGEVAAGFPAQKAGVQPGDVILKVDEEEITQWVDLPSIIPKSEGKEIQLTIKRGKEVITIRVTPRTVIEKNDFSGEEVKTYQIGIAPTKEIKREPVYRSIGLGFYQTWYITKETIVFVVKIITGKEKVKKAIGGPILIGKIVAMQAHEGFLNLLLITAFISINLGILNLFPIPILDGGHLLFLTIEAIRRRPLSVRKMEVIQQIGLMVILLLMIYVVFNDLERVGFMKFIMKFFSPGAK